MDSNYEIDKVDRQILAILQKDARTPYLEIARTLLVSGGTVHQRIERMKKYGIIKGSKIVVDYEKLGQSVNVWLALHLKTAKDLNKVINKLRLKKEVVEVYYTTGTFALMIKVMLKNIKEYHLFLVEQIQDMAEIQSTESFICLDNPISRELDLSV